MIIDKFNIRTQWQIQTYCISYPIPDARWYPLAGCTYETEESAIHSLDHKIDWEHYLRLVKIQTITMVDEVLRCKDRRV